jgi:hypothetical protein
VWLERFGTRYLTLLNSTPVEAETTVRVDMRRMAPLFGGEGTLRFVDIVTGEVVSTTPLGPITSIHLRLGPEQSRALRLDFASKRGLQPLRARPVIR